MKESIESYSSAWVHLGNKQLNTGRFDLEDNKQCKTAKANQADFGSKHLLADKRMQCLDTRLLIFEGIE